MSGGATSAAAATGSNGGPSLGGITSVVESQIRYLVNNVSKKNIKSTAEELKQMTATFGADAYLVLVQAYVEALESKDSGGSGQQQQRLQLAAGELATLVDKPSLPGLILRALEAGNGVPQEEFVSRFARGLKMTLPQEVAVALALAGSIDPRIQAEGVKFLKSKLPDLSQPQHALPESVLHSLLYFFRTHDGFVKHEVNALRALNKTPVSALALVPLTENATAWNMRADLLRGQPDVATAAAGSRPCRLADLMEELGYGCCASASTLRELLSQQPGGLREPDIAAVLGMMMRTHSTLDESVPVYTLAGESGGAVGAAVGETHGWQVSTFVDMARELLPKLSWPGVMKALDYPTFFVPDAKAFAMLLAAYRRACKEPFPVQALVDTWSNTRGQLSLLRFALDATAADGLDWSTLPVVPPRLPDVLLSTPAALTWQSVALVRTLLRLAETENYGVVRALFDKPLKQCPDVLLVTLAKVKKPVYTTLHSELSALLLSMYLSNHGSSNYVLQQLWAINRTMLVRGMVDLYNKDRASLSRMLDIAHELKAISTILDSRPFNFVIDLAALAAHREFLYLEKWLTDKINEHETPFIKACIQWLREKTSEKEHQGPGVAVSLDTLNIFFKCLHQKMSLLSPEMVEELKQLVMHNAHHSNTSVAGGGSAQDSSEVGTPAQDMKFPPEIEDVSNGIFRQIYRCELSIPNAVALLKRLKESKVQRDELVFLCIIHNLFDEYRYFPKFPEKELQITGLLFGALIQHQLITYIPLGMALRYVLEALRKPPGSNMFTFGVTALEQFKARLSEWPQYCSHLLQIPHLRQTQSELVDFIEKINATPSAAGAVPMMHVPPQQLVGHGGVSVAAGVGVGIGGGGGGGVGAATAGASAPGGGGGSGGGATMTTGGAAAAAESAAAAAAAAATAKDSAVPTTKDEMNPNFEKLKIFASSESKSLPEPDEAVQDKISFIMNNLSPNNMDKKAAEFRDCLRVEFCPWFAHYLVTKRVSIEPNFHALYIQFLDKVSLPLIHPVLHATVESARLLLRSSNIKDNSGERGLLKNLGSWLGQLTLARNKPLLQRDLYLKGIIHEAFEQGRLIVVIPFVCKILESCKSRIFSYPNVWVTAQLRALMEVYQIPNLKLNLKIEIELLFNNLGVDMKEIKPSTMLLLSKDKPTPSPASSAAAAAAAAQPPLAPSMISQDILAPAIDRAIKDIITPVVERSGSIACVTTRELVMKDFAAEPDESKVRKAAQVMAQNLAAHLAMVTCKEPLRVSITNHVRALLVGVVNAQTEQAQMALENAISAAVNDCLEVACSVIEKAAREKAARDIDEATVGLAFQYQQRKKHREMNPGRPFFDPVFFSQQHRYPVSLPDILRPKANDPHQLRVYDDYTRLRSIAASAAKADAAGNASTPSMPGGGAGDMGMGSSPPAPSMLSSSPPLHSSLMSAGGGMGIGALAFDKATPKLPLAGIPAPGKAKMLDTRMPEQVKSFFEEWLQLSLDPVPNEKAVAQFLAGVAPFLKTEETQTNFFRLYTDICVEYHDRQNAASMGGLSYIIVDSYARLVTVVVRSIGDPNAKYLLLQSVFNGVTSLLSSDYDLKKTKFDQRPYYRLFTNWLQDLPTDQTLDALMLYVQILGNCFLKIRPSVIPAFAFGWVELIFHRLYMPKLLLSKGQKGWPMFKRLLVELLRFLEPYLRNAELTEPIRLLYKGTLKALLVLLHDFPEFLCDFHYSFCDVIPPSCIQLRNIILSAFPRHMHLPDPFTPNLKIDRLPEINNAPHVLSDYTSALSKNNFKAEIDAFLKTRNAAFFVTLKSRLMLSPAEATVGGSRYNAPVINALMMYVGTQAILLNKAGARGQQAAVQIARQAPMEIYQFLAQELDPEGRYLFLNAIANQLRYPNNHTHYFSCVLLFLFMDAKNQEIIKEQITRVLLERLIVNRPHPWGLLITFLEIIKNPRYDFWKNSFTRCDPEIKRLFESVSKTCMGGKNKMEALPGGEAPPEHES